MAVRSRCVGRGTDRPHPDSCLRVPKTADVHRLPSGIIGRPNGRCHGLRRRGAQILPTNLLFAADPYAVVVRGDGINSWGHMLLHAPGASPGTYFQVAGVRACPRYLTDDGFRRYRKETDKNELRRFPVRVPDKRAAHCKLEEVLSKPWMWSAVVHNCVSFVEDIVIAGGGRPIHDGLFFNPSRSTQHTPGATGSW